MVKGGAGEHLFELRIVRRDGKPLPEIEYEGKVYAVGESGEQVVVQVRNLKSKPELVKAALAVDGKDAGYSKKITEPLRWNSFDGFWVSPVEKKAFIFSKPTVVDQASAALRGEDNAGVSAPGNVGRVRARFLPAEYFLCPGKGCDRCQFLGHEPSPSGNNNNNNSSVDGKNNTAAVDDSSAKGAERVLQATGKKFFNNPSLCMAAGVSMPRTLGTKRRQHACELPNTPSSSLALFCETADTLFMRGVLQRNRPEHMALLTPAMRKAFKVPDPEPVPDSRPDAPLAITAPAPVPAPAAAAAAAIAPAPAHASSSAPPPAIASASAHPSSTPAPPAPPAPAPPQNPGPSHFPGPGVGVGADGERSEEGREAEADAPPPPPLVKRVKREKGLAEVPVKESQEARLDFAAGAEVEEGDDECAVLRVPKRVPELVDCDALL